MDSYFEKEVRLNGTLWVKGYVHFDGYFEGEIYSSNNFAVGKAGKVLGNIKSYNVTNKGNIQGNLFAENKVVLVDGSRLLGDISTYRLKIDEGSNFEGRCKMIDVPPKTIKEEIEDLQPPVPYQKNKLSQILKTTTDKNVSIVSTTVISLVAGIIWYII